MNYRPNMYYATWWIKSKDNAFKRHFFRDYKYMRGILGRDTYLHKVNEKSINIRRSAILNKYPIFYGKISV